MITLTPVIFTSFIKIKCPLCNSIFYENEARAYKDIPGQFLIHCPACIDNFDFKTNEEFRNA